jgi:hypothetical protein
MKFSQSNSLHASTRKKAIVLVFALIVWSLFLWRAVETFGPDGGYIQVNSDSAITVLMANDERPITVFDTYYYGADRWGGWPLIIARLFNHSTGFRWSFERLHAARSAWLFLGILILALLNRGASLPVVVISIIVMCLSYIIRLMLFDLSQVYAWQITALLLSWLALRKWFEQLSASGTRVQTNVAWVGWSLLVFFFSLLAILNSSVSGPLLLFLVGVEALRSIIKMEKGLAVGRSLLSGFKPLCLILLAVLGEILLRINYHRYGLKHYQTEFRTRIALDAGYLRANLKAHLQSLATFEWWALILLAVITVVAVGALVIYFCLRRRESLTSMRQLFLDDTSFTIVGAVVIAAINFAIVTLVDHVRLSLYDSRYLTLTFFFGSLAGFLIIWRILKFALEQLGAHKYAGALFASIALVLITIAFPAKLQANAYDLQKETALTLAQKSPNAVLMGGYWETYVFSALQPTHTMTPLPLEGYLVRMPWAITTLHGASEVIVEYKHSRVGDAEPPPERLFQYSESLRLVDPKWYENSEYAFARYMREPK